MQTPRWEIDRPEDGDNVSRQKAQGTAFETWLVEDLKERGWSANRIAEGGIFDIGDVEARDWAGWNWIFEAKARERLNIPREVAKAKAKVGTAATSVLVWKRLAKRKSENGPRQPDGARVIVAMDWDTFTSILGGVRSS